MHPDLVFLSNQIKVFMYLRLWNLMSPFVCNGIHVYTYADRMYKQKKTKYLQDRRWSY